MFCSIDWAIRVSLLESAEGPSKIEISPTAEYSAAATRNKSIAMLRTYQGDAGLLVRAASKGVLS